jgi:hypothetical protein
LTENFLRFPGRGYSKIMEDASDTEEEKFQCNSSDSNSSSSQLKEANINMSAREVLDSCRGKKFKKNIRTTHVH